MLAAEVAAVDDVLRRSRPRGAGVDVGALEFDPDAPRAAGGGPRERARVYEARGAHVGRVHGRCARGCGAPPSTGAGAVLVSVWVALVFALRRRRCALETY